MTVPRSLTFPTHNSILGAPFYPATLKHTPLNPESPKALLNPSVDP